MFLLFNRGKGLLLDGAGKQCVWIICFRNFSFLIATGSKQIMSGLCWIVLVGCILFCPLSSADMIWVTDGLEDSSKFLNLQ